MEHPCNEEFRNPSSRYRGAPFWSWNTKIEKETMLAQLKVFKEMGFGGYHIHPRVGLATPYLAEEYIALVKACVEEGKKLGLFTYLYDEDRWPSGFAGGIVTKHPEYRMKHLLFTKVQYGTKKDKVEKNIMGNFAVGVRSEKGNLLACYDVVLNEAGYLEKYQLIHEAEDAEGCKWYAYVEENPIHPWYNGGTYVDVLNKSAIDCFLECTHEVYKKYLSEEFGKMVPSIFTDEPHMLFKTNFSHAFSGEDLFIPWTNDLLTCYEQQFNRSLLTCLPELFWDSDGLQYSSGRFGYHRLVADLFETAYAANIGSWCKKNNIAFTGHYLYEESLYQQNRSDGDLLRMYRHMDIPGMDLLFNEVDLTTAKQIQSIVHQYGKKGAMSELYGVTNWSFDFRGYKFQGDWQAALGISFRVPHLALMTMEGEGKRDFPASIFYQSPWYKEFKQLEDHFSRINVVMEKGDPIVHLAVIHPLESYWLSFGPEDTTGMLRKDMDDDFLNLIHWLLPNGVDFDYLSEGLLSELCPDVDYPLQAGKMKYQAILVPNCITLRETTIELLEQFHRSGGTVLVAGEYPAAVDGHRSWEIQSRMEACSKRIPFAKYAILTEVGGFREVQLLDSEGIALERFIYQLKNAGNEKLLFIAPIKEPDVKDISSCEELYVILQGEYTPLQYDTLSGRIEELPASYEKGQTIFKKRMYGYDSLLVRLKKGRNLNPAADQLKQLEWKPYLLDNKVSYELEEPNVFLLDMAQAALDDEPYSSMEEILRIDSKIRIRLGYPLRGSSMAQPYTKKGLPPKHVVHLRYYIPSEINVENVFLALEERKDTKILWNGRDIDSVQIGFYVDHKIEKVELGRLSKGINKLELQVPFGEHTNLEAAYLLGDFGVQVVGKNSSISDKPKQIAFGSLVGQNLDFYSGNIVYSLEVDCPDGKIKIKASKYRGALIGVFIDEERVGNILYPPYELELTDLTRGKHRVKLCLFGNRYNTFSHLHTSDDSTCNNSRPSLWRTMGEEWCYEYNLIDFGILKTPEIFV